MKTAEKQPRQVPVTDFKAHCTEYLRAVENGEDSIQITRHGKVVAKLMKSDSTDGFQSVSEWIGGGRGTVVFSPNYDPHAPAFEDDEWELNKD